MFIFLSPVMKHLCQKKQLRQFWARSVDSVVLYANSETLLGHLERYYGSEIRATYDINTGKGGCNLDHWWIYIEILLRRFPPPFRDDFYFERFLNWEEKMTFCRSHI